MIRPTLFAAALVAALPALALAQQPSIQNGHVETRAATTLDRDVTAIGGSATDPVWIAWREPMIDGARNMCSWYSDRDHPDGIRGDLLDGGDSDVHAPRIATPTGPVPLESGTGVVMLVRMVDRHVERVRTIGDDCPVDANGRTVYWLTGVAPAESLQFLDGLARTQPGTLTRGGVQSLVAAAVSAIGLHRDAGADALLDRLAAASDTDSDLRRRAASILASSRGAHGFDEIRQLLGTEKTADMRRSLASDLATTWQPGTVEALLALAKTDPDPSIRATAIAAVPVRGGAAALPDVLNVIKSDATETVKTRAVTGISRMPNDGGLVTLLDLARNSPDLAVRKQAVTEIGRSKDPRAFAYLEEIIK